MQAIQKISREKCSLLDLPEPIHEDILWRAGPHTRELSKACKKLYGPLMSLTPRDINSSQALVSALTFNGRYLQLTALNLEHVSNSVTDGSLQALCCALPNLQQLRLPEEHAATPGGLAAALLHASCLTALHFAPASRQRYGLTIGSTWSMLGGIGRLPQLQHLTLPAAFAESVKAFSSLRACTQLSKLCFSKHVGQRIAVQNLDVRVWAERLPALTAVEVELPMARLFARDTQLNVNEATDGLYYRPASAVLLEVASMTRLQSLQLYMKDRGGWTPAEQGWLTHLPQLTSLDVSYHMGYHAQGDGALNEVASAVPHLRHLRALRVTAASCAGCDMLSARAFNCIASASSTLELLHLRGLALPPLADALAGMTHLTSLGFNRCWTWAKRGTPQMNSMPWLTSLTRLRELTLCNEGVWGQQLELEVQHMVHLSSLQTLRLHSCAFADALYMQQLLTSLRQLQCLGVQP